MSSVIRHINPINWFNYKGSDNHIYFSSGTNVLVGTNNAGKTKLHNAFRFLLSDRVIIKVKVSDDKVYQEIKADNEKYTLEIFNESAYSELKINDIGSFGVELCFTKKSSTEEKNYIVKKIIKLRKISDSKFEITENFRQVYSVDPRTKSSRRTSEKVDDIVNFLITPMYRKFFLVEGEQMGMMTPLQGEGLKTTIKNLTSINTIDKVVDVVDSLQKKVNSDIKKYESQLDSLSEDDKLLMTQKHVKENELKELGELIESDDELRQELEDNISNIRVKNDESKDKKLLLSDLEGLLNDKKNIEERIDYNYRDFIDSLTDSKSFYISKIFDENHVNDDFEKIDKNFAGFLKERRIELEKNISEEDQLILQKLVKTEPHPDILKEMIEDHVKKCYICKSNLGKENVDFIKNVLIPHYEMSYDNDDYELNLLSSIKDSIKIIFHEARQEYSSDEHFISEARERIADLTQEKIDKQKEIDDFIGTHGDKDDLDRAIDVNILDQFASDNLDLGKLKSELAINNKALKALKTEIKDLSEKLEKNNKSDNKLESYNNLNDFITDLDVYFEKIKENVYDDFALSLQEKASLRFKKLMRNNPTTKNHKLIVNVDKRDIGYRKKYSFEIYLQNKRGKKLTQEGGASSTLETLSVVFGLIDYANKKQTFPFIADAPISRLTPDTKESFFETIIDDEILSQNIIIVMDLWDNKKNNINELAKDVLKLIEPKSDSSFIILKPKENNMGVEFNYLKNGK